MAQLYGRVENAHYRDAVYVFICRKAVTGEKATENRRLRGQEAFVYAESNVFGN